MALIEDEVRFIRALVRNPHATSSSSLLSATYVSLFRRPSHLFRMRSDE